MNGPTPSEPDPGLRPAGMTEDLPLPPLAGGRSISSPAQRLLPDHRRFSLVENAWYAWEHGRGDSEALCIVVPAGFEHDFASVPRALWSFISPFDLGLAALFHDWLYRHAGAVETLVWKSSGSSWTLGSARWKRYDADRLFARIMREHGVARWRRRMAFRAVNAFGEQHWGA